ncbi:unnamed protein product [Fusarium graminearum]|uniref:Chromosome 2, complete genome n=2 Tax=Gibberella zeae TaxID=5518 RepID=A0A0E0S0U1_GIBZE|nr:hypothetical protein FG05_30205 [Fusarium graminearum]CAF3465246.1 unnamed protein product [Fusarium graminearum]CAF3480886.1 unnamed protein product [Fusarium graminearum]CAF3498862.1 unnamed protein product [Fusarium graminearum]CAG1960729.1 unnamed protein product [Fusarium graminearum]
MKLHVSTPAVKSRVGPFSDVNASSSCGCSSTRMRLSISVASRDMDESSMFRGWEIVSSICNTESTCQDLEKMLLSPTMTYFQGPRDSICDVC